MFIANIKTPSDVNVIKEKLSRAVEDTNETITILQEMFACDQIELFYHDEAKSILKNIQNDETISLSHLSKNSILGRAFLLKKSLIINALTTHSKYNIALDNPYKLNISSQILLCIHINEKVQGIIRLSNSSQFDKIFIEKLRLFGNSFKDIFLNEIYKTTQPVEKSAFEKNTTKIYMTLKKIKNLYSLLDTHTEHPEVKKLIKNGDSNVDTILEYINPNIDNISVVKKNLKKLQVSDLNNTKNPIRVLIADDVIMNVKILNAMLMNEDIEEIEFAYDGTEAINKVLNSYKNNKIINVLFLDHHMPGKVGSEVAEALKKEEKQLSIVSITNDPDAIKEKTHLYNYHLSKPFSKESILRVFHNIQNDFK